LTTLKSSDGGRADGEPKASKRKGVKQVKKARFTQRTTPPPPANNDAPPLSSTFPSSQSPSAPTRPRKVKPTLDNIEIENIEKKMLARFGSSKIKNVKTTTGDKDGEKPIVKRDRLKHYPWEKKNSAKASSNFETKFEKDLVVGEDDDDGEDPDEFYDEDDEGFEEIPLDDEDEQNNNSNDDSIKNEVDSILKKERPVIKRGGIFGRAVVDAVEEPQKKSKFSSSDRSSDLSSSEEEEEEEEETKKKKGAKPPTPDILVDAKGKNLTLSLDVVTREMTYAENVNLEGSKPVAASGGDEFENLGITQPQLLQNLKAMKCATALPSQQLSLPILLSNRDCLISTHTGSGKTLAFLIPLIEKILNNALTDKTQSVKAVIICPGRELASQITSVCREVIKDTDLSVMMTIGGTAYAKNAEGLRKNKPSIVVGTPGRVAELMCGGDGRDKGVMKLSGCSNIILDEFDNLLMSSAYKESTEAIYDSVIKARSGDVQCVMCSATARDMRTGQVERFLKGDYGEVDIGGYGRNMEGVDKNDETFNRHNENAIEVKPLINLQNPMSQSSIHGYIKLPHQRLALELLRKILHTEPSPQQVLVFVNDKHRVNVVLDKMAEKGIIGAGLSGGAEKDDRTEVARALREGRVGLVVSTEIAARGLDAPYLTHVINLDLPSSSSHYCHRAGRVGRGGKPGVVVSLACGGKEGGVVQRFGRELGILVNEVDVRGGLMRIVKQAGNVE